MLKLYLCPESFKLTLNQDGTPSNQLECGDFSVHVARRDWAAAQLILTSDEDCVVSLTGAPAFSPVVPKPVLRFSCAAPGLGQTSIRPISFIAGDDGALRGDGIGCCDDFEIKAGEWAALWIEVQVPEDTAPGEYTCSIDVYRHRLFEPEERMQTRAAFQVYVADVVMPAAEEHRFFLDLWQHPSNIARKHETALWSDAHFEVLKPYVESLAQLGQKCVTLIVSEIPWSGQCSYLVPEYPSNLFEYSMVRVTQELDGGFAYDFSPLDRYIKLCKDCGIDAEYEVFGLVNIWVHPEVELTNVAPDDIDALRVRYFDRQSGTYRFMDTAEQLEGYIQAVTGHLEALGLKDRVRIVADEPADVELYQKRLERIERLAPGFRLKCAINHVEFIEAMCEQVDDYVPLSVLVAEKWEELNALRGVIRGRICWYVCCQPDYPNTFLASPLCEARLIGPLTSYMNLDGFLRWNYTVWPEEPRKRLSYQYPGWKAGDTNFVYPAWNGKPLLTLRWKALRRGIEDFELCERVKEKCGTAALEVLWPIILRKSDIRQLYADGAQGADFYSLDERDYDRFREALLLLLEKK